MPTRMTGTGIYRFDRILPGLGRFQISSGTRSLPEYRRRDGIVTKCAERGLLEVLRLLRAGALSWPELLEADRRDRLTRLVEDRKLDVPLWATVGELDADGWDDADTPQRAWLPVSARERTSRRRYRTSLRKLRDLLADPRLTIRQLEHLDWRRLRRRWNGGQADWNRMRAAVSSFLTWHFDDEYHPARVAVVRRIPWARESQGVLPDATPEDFWRVVSRTPEHARPAYVAMVVLGVGPKEYIGIRAEDLAPAQLTVTVNGTKTWARRRVVAVDERLWDWVERAVPAPLAYRWLNTYWTRACEAEGVRLRMYDLRHLSAQYAGDRGATDRDLSIHLGHSNPAMSHRYSRRATARVVALAIAEELVGPNTMPAPQKLPQAAGM